MTIERLNSREIVILRSLIQRGGDRAPISLLKWQREPAIPLWRRELLTTWYRQSPDGPLDGPFYRLTEIGAHLAAKFYPAPRGSSGAMESGL